MKEDSLESREDMIEQSRKRWVQSKPDSHLTWDKQISGDAFIKKILTNHRNRPMINVLEIGPGYGRLLKSFLKENLVFSNYYGVDMSAKNIDYLKKNFSSSNMHFFHGNAENIKLDIKFDMVISSLTFKHMFPSFKSSLRNISNHLTENGMIYFDLLEGNVAFFSHDDTFIRFYTKSQIKEILNESRLQLISFDKVVHARGYPRLLVVARKPS